MSRHHDKSSVVRTRQPVREKSTGKRRGRDMLGAMDQATSSHLGILFPEFSVHTLRIYSP